MLTNSDFPRNFSALATKPLTILLSIGVHYVLASNLGIFSLPPLKPRPFGGTVKVVDLTPAERTRVPEVVRATPVPIVPTPAPVIRNSPDFSRLPAAPLTNPSPLTKKSSSATPSGNQSGSDNGSSNRPKKDIPKVKKSSDPTYSVSKKGPTLEKIKPDKSTPALRGTTSSQKPEEDEASGSDNSAGSKPIETPNQKPGNPSKPRTPTPKPKNPSEAANGRKNSREAVAQQFKQEVEGSLRKEYPNLQTEKLAVETPNSYKISIRNCITSKSQDTYITVGIFYPQFKSDNPHDQPKSYPSVRVSGNAKDSSFINNLTYGAYESFDKKVSDRLNAIPEDKRYSVPRLFTTDLVYSAKNCTN
jgi:hypothetical protein